jgi:hypothetical protein
LIITSLCASLSHISFEINFTRIAESVNALAVVTNDSDFLLLPRLNIIPSNSISLNTNGPTVDIFWHHEIRTALDVKEAGCDVLWSLARVKGSSKLVDPLAALLKKMEFSSRTGPALLSSIRHAEKNVLQAARVSSSMHEPLGTASKRFQGQILHQLLLDFEIIQEQTPMNFATQYPEWNTLQKLEKTARVPSVHPRVRDGVAKEVSSWVH